MGVDPDVFRHDGGPLVQFKVLSTAPNQPSARTEASPAVQASPRRPSAACEAIRDARGALHRAERKPGTGLTFADSAGWEMEGSKADMAVGLLNEYSVGNRELDRAEPQLGQIF